LFHYSKRSGKAQSQPPDTGRLHPVHPFNACRPSAVSTPPAPLSSLQSEPSASPHIPRVLFAVDPCRGVAPLKEVVVDLADAARSGFADLAHVGLKINDGGHIRLRAQNSARLLGN